MKRVLAAVHFSPVLKIADPDGSGIAAFQEIIRGEYPRFGSDDAHHIRIETNKEGGIEPTLLKLRLWRFFDRKQLWRVTLTQESITIETQTAYASRSILFDRLRFLVEAVEKAFAPAEIMRVGFRYLNILEGEDLERLDSNVRPDLWALYHRDTQAFLKHSSATSEFEGSFGTLLVKHGIVPTGGMHEFMEAEAPNVQWYLDLDAIEKDPNPFDWSILEQICIALTDQICSFFRWAMTPEFLEAHRDQH